MQGLMLVVDDQEINREILRVLFQKQYDIMTAESAEEAIVFLQGCQGSIDIVLLDLQLPGISGFDLLERRKSIECFRDVPVVVITSSESKEDQIRAFELGASDFVQKPFVPEIVVSRVNNVMASVRRLWSVEQEAKKLKLKSETDTMTGLFNKTTMELLVTERLKVSAGQLDAMLVIDIDHFKTVNDTTGHQAGDKVIRVVANLISSRFRKSDYVGRVGGDEFCVLMVDVPSRQIVYEKANELVQIMRYKPNLAIPDYVTLSIGIATNEKRATGYAELFKKADEALYNAKQKGRARCQEYGVEEQQLSGERGTVLVISNDRSVCSTVHALLPAQLEVLEALSLDELCHLTPEERARTSLIYLDVSNVPGDAAALWQQAAALDWLDPGRVIAICREGSLAQYRVALAAGVLDLFTAPLEVDAFKRRSRRQLLDHGLLHEEE